MKPDNNYYAVFNFLGEFNDFFPLKKTEGEYPIRRMCGALSLPNVSFRRWEQRNIKVEVCSGGACHFSAAGSFQNEIIDVGVGIAIGIEAY
ncbi:MAG: hypothetical protein JW915_21460 [Chitinispirillaceae bacterium]|nr:hypothetical protein [Chitinispirillaceae bacterium]